MSVFGIRIQQTVHTDDEDDCTDSVQSMQGRGQQIVSLSTSQKGGGWGGDGGVEGGFSITLECYQRWRGRCV